MDMDEEITNQTFDVIDRHGVKRGVAYDVNPVNITNNDECLVILRDLKLSLPGSCELLDSCIKVLESADGDDAQFGPMEIISLSQLAMEHSDKTSEILACTQYLSECIEYGGDVDTNLLGKLISAYSSLGDILTNGLEPNKDGNEGDDDDEEYDDSEEDDEEEDGEIVIPKLLFAQQTNSTQSGAVE